MFHVKHSVSVVIYVQKSRHVWTFGKILEYVSMNSTDLHINCRHTNSGDSGIRTHGLFHAMEAL